MQTSFWGGRAQVLDSLDDPFFMPLHSSAGKGLTVDQILNLTVEPEYRDHWQKPGFSLLLH